MKKKSIIITCACVAAALVIGGVGLFIWAGKDKSKSDNVVYVNTVEKLMSLGSGNGMMNRFSGVVESQDTWKVQQNSEKTVKDILVEEGQEVQVGTPLFTYDTDKFQSDLEQAELDLERIENEITSMKDNITQLNKDKKSASKENQATLQLQIQEAELQLKQKEYEAKSKQIEIDKFHENISNATVTSEIAGVVKSINNGSAEMDMYGNTDTSFMTILATGDYQIKGKVNELNMGAIAEGAPVIVHSRVDSSVTWKGTVSKVDRDNAEANNNNYMYGGGDSMSQTTSYPFYVTLESSENLMLGQHVYMELDNGQDSEPKAGIWLDEYFINDLDAEPYVWADNGKNKLEKRKVTLGQYDESMMKYEIADGLKKEDAITFPEAGLEEGMETTISEDGMMGQSNPAGLDEGDMIGGDDIPMDDTMNGDMDNGEALPEGDIVEGEEGMGQEVPGDAEGGTDGTAAPQGEGDVK
ncbi:MAG TPA: efflux RND transporter periplasmic adaptor subunit [Candidatus Pelethocola excrementipullorum]|nr:efflux RND transporter periplasmic adaptor subunit [Candidatus Pelethocola excrementipullorum]